ncbi:2-dehydro-3-deoxy-6-phosphogalactonate aldolase [Endozoicomonas ascidiicola]|uniref:2-dehydro-3-deoxy-6-phosphogalactonate aldolase n=1 Tax=Endozoicomonas ascidiicola TaxID=1698521 RepID=UPI000833B61B|nr:2-dehydro-3-deoxy-6-phosphogalactonate aldolase [Endozoicomonas ascidiicola]
MKPAEFKVLCNKHIHPLIAILRGIQPEEAVSIASALVEGGFYFIEVPMNSPKPLDSIRIMAESFGGKALIGAGTVLSVKDVEDVYAVGGRMIVTPNCNPEVIGRAKSLGMACFPGVATPTEAFMAMAAGATALKAFPSDLVSPSVVKAMLAVLPKETAILPVGGINSDPDQMVVFLKAGACGFGLGSSLYAPGDLAEVVKQRATSFISALQKAKELI